MPPTLGWLSCLSNVHMQKATPKYALGSPIRFLLSRSFRRIFFGCTQQAKGNQLREELSSQRPSICGATKISPLVGAAFSSNWVLFRQVYDSFEELTGGYWLRDMVRRVRAH